MSVRSATPPDQEILGHEAAVLGCVLMDASGSSLLADIPDPLVFQHAPHRTLFYLLRKALPSGAAWPGRPELHEGVIALAQREALADVDRLLLANAIATYISIDDSRSALRTLIRGWRQRALVKTAAALADGVERGDDPLIALQAFDDQRRQIIDSANDHDRLTQAAECAADLWNADIAQPRLLLGDFFEAGGFAIFYGQPGLGKTFAALQLALALARGTDWFGIPTNASRVGILSLELDRYYLKLRLRAITGETQGLERIVLVSRPALKGSIDLLSPADQAAITAFIRRFQLDVIMIDALSRAHTIDENDSKEIGQLLAACDAIRSTTSCAIILLHHERKAPNSAGSSDLDAIRGSTRLISDPTLLIRLVKTGGCLRLRCAKANVGAEFDEIFLKRLPNGVLEATPKPPEAAALAAQNREALLAILPDRRGAAATLKTLRAATDLRKNDNQPVGENTVRNYLQKLKVEGRADCVGRGAGARWYRTANEPSPNAPLEPWPIDANSQSDNEEDDA